MGVSGGDDRTIVVWNFTNGSKAKLTGHTGTVRAVALSGKKDQVLSGGDDRILRVWDVKTAKEIKTLHGHSGTIRSIAFISPFRNALTAAVGPFDNTVRLWDVDGRKQIRIVGRNKDGMNAIAATPTGDRVLSAGEDGMLRFWDTTKPSTDSPMPSADALVEVTRFNSKSDLGRVAVSRDGRRILTAGPDGAGRIWDAATGKELFALKSGTAALHFAEFSSDGKLALTGGADKKARVWNAETGALLRTFDTHNATVRTGVFTTDSGLVLTAGDDKTALMWKADTGEIVQRFDNQQAGAIQGAAVSPDGKRVLTASENGTVGLWEVTPGQTARFLKSIPTGQELVSSVAFLPDGKWAVTGGRDRSAAHLEPRHRQG